MAFRFACQEQLLPGDSLERKWEFATRAGYDGIELRGKGGFTFRERLPELRRAAAAGVVMPTVCVDMPHFFGAFDARLRADAIAQLASQLSVIAEIGGRGAMTPASYGMFSRRLPPFQPPRDEARDREVLIEGLASLGEHAAREGVQLYLEPLNRYEDHMVNRLGQAAELIKQVGLDSVRIAADTYHMNVEEDDLAAALLEAGPYIGHVHASESNRHQPGTGHTDWPGVLRALDTIGYDGYLTLECRPRGEPAAAIATVPAFLSRAALSGPSSRNGTRPN
jgi:sugar phosphate isomerase/epimerase